MGLSDREELLKQAERADSLADQATDQEVVKNLRDAAANYRREAAEMENGGPRPPPDEMIRN